MLPSKAIYLPLKGTVITNFGKSNDIHDDFRICEKVKKRLNNAILQPFLLKLIEESPIGVLATEGSRNLGSLLLAGEKPGSG